MPARQDRGQDLLDEVTALPGVAAVEAPDGTPPPRYNIAPTQQVPLIRIDGDTARLDAARWGLLPSWKKDETGPPLFNARGETVAEKPSFRSAFKARRGLMVLDGYYEWRQDEGGKQELLHRFQPMFGERASCTVAVSAPGASAPSADSPCASSSA